MFEPMVCEPGQRAGVIEERRRRVARGIIAVANGTAEQATLDYETERLRRVEATI